MIPPSLNLRTGQAKQPTTLPVRATVAALVAAMLASTGHLHADSATYTGTGADGVFDNGANWSTGTPPGDTTGVTTNADVATFTAATPAAVTLTTARNLGSILFNGATTYTIGTTGGPAFLLSSGGNITANASSVSQNVNAPLILQNAAAATSGIYTIESDTPGANRLFIFNGAISSTATTGGVTSLTLTGTSAPTSGNQLTGILSDGAGGGKLALVKTGTGLWQIGNAGNTFSGGVTVSGGTLRDSIAGNTSAVLGTGTVTFNGGNLILGSTQATTFNNPAIVNAVTGNALTFRTNDNFSPTSMTGTGTLTITNNNSAGTTVTTANVQGFGGTLDIEAGGSFATTLRIATGAATTVGLQNATLNLGANASLSQQTSPGTNGTVTTTIGAISGAGTIGAAGAATGGVFVYDVGSNNASTTFSGAITNGTSPTVSALTKSGTGTLTLSGTTNTYSGTTTVNAGTLLLSTGSINNSLTVQVTAGALTLQNTTALADTGTLNLASGTALNLDAASGSETIGSLILNGATVPTNTTYTAAQLNAMGTGVTFESLNGETLTVGVIPEPGTWMAGMLLIGAAGFHQRRRVKGLLVAAKLA